MAGHATSGSGVALDGRVFRRGDVVHLDFDPQSGREMKGNHYALVISNDLFNKSGMCMVCPITQGSYHRDGGFTTTLMGTGIDTQGVVVASEAKIRSGGAQGAL